MRKFTTVICAAVILAVVSFGCGKQKMPDGMPELVKFDLTITQGGAPLEGATVMLKSDLFSYSVDGLTDSKGVAKLMTQGQYPGAPAAEYKVSVTKKVPTESKFGNICPPSDSEAAKWQADRKAEYRPTHSFVEAKYGLFEESGLTVSITAGGKATLDVGAAVDDIEIPEDSAPEPAK